MTTYDPKCRLVEIPCPYIMLLCRKEDNLDNEDDKKGCMHSGLTMLIYRPQRLHADHAALKDKIKADQN